MTDSSAKIIETDLVMSPGLDRTYLYALMGGVLGLAAPLGWLLLRAIFWAPMDQSFWSSLIGDAFVSRENFFRYLYMGGGTSAVLAIFGFFAGRASQQIHQRAQRLDELHVAAAQQKEEFSQRYHELNKRIHSFHSITARLERSIDETELYKLTSHALHDVLEFDRVNLLRVDDVTQQLLLISCRGGVGAETADIRLPLDQRAGVLYKAVTDKRFYLVDDIHLMPADFRLQPPCDKIERLRSLNFLVCPVAVGEKVVALIALDNKISHRSLDSSDADTVQLLANQLGSALIRMGLIGAVENLTNELERTFHELEGYRERYKTLLGVLKDSSSTTAGQVGDIATSADVVLDAVNATQSASTEILSSIEEVGDNISQLSEFMEKSISAMSEIAAAIRSVEEHSVRSHQISEKTRDRAEHGVQSVAETLKGLQGISTGVAEAADAMGRLSSRGNEVSTISSVITEIARKTNLLALNAAIIAAQAGEQGRSFAVVAEEIRELSHETARSSEAITGLIRDMQTGMTQVVTQIDTTQKLVDNGFDKGRGADAALEQILTSAAHAMDMAQRIRQATREVSSSAEFVTHSIEELGQMTDQVSSASREQVLSTRSIVRSIEDVRHMAEDMARITASQLKSTGAIETAVESVSEMALRIFTSMEKRRRQSLTVIARLQQMKESK